ncbi:MAG: Gfo/Idh/MocA family oxidoreductase [Anaerolineaceae bacterium]|nr:Gfo/Idh/MocA family oxidoreductase [Anaerolineaceae bacterium]NTV35517.1 Gfo/Idh/MocA family oxidoreductase [Anaerolineaceae bacterium]
MDRIRLGIVGCGYWGPNLIRNFEENPNAQVVIVSDLKKERLTQIKNTYPDVLTTQNYSDLFLQNLDAVVIATPPPTHFAIASDCIKHGLHVMVEKPLTLDSKTSQELVDIAVEHNRVLMVGHTFQYHGAIIALKNLIDSGELGEIYYLDTARLNLGLYSRELNVLWDLAPHDISILFYLLGSKPTSVSAHGTSCVIEGIHDVAYVNLAFPNNIMAHVHVSWLDPAKVRRVTVVGSKKMAVLNDISTTEKIKIYDKGVTQPENTDSYGEFLISYHSGDVLIPNVRMAEPLKVECQHFLDCITTGGNPCSGGVDGLNVVKVLEAAHKSLVNSGHVEVMQW